MTFEPLHLAETIHISRIYTIHYFEYASSYHFSGESHNFWEFLCVDKGEVEITAGTSRHILTKGQIVFHEPNEFHNVRSSGRTAPNLVVISFECSSPVMKRFSGLITSIGESERIYLAKIIIEAKKCIATPLDDPYTQKMDLNPSAPPGSQQLIRIYLELFLLSMLRRMDGIDKPLPTIKSVTKKNDLLIYGRITSYLEEHIREKLTIDDICKANLVSRSQLQKLFKEEHNCGVIDYFCREKIEAAKRMIREDRDNFTEISEYLGYTSIHYFSRQFKKITGMSPSEYASSIKALSDE